MKESKHDIQRLERYVIEREEIHVKKAQIDFSINMKMNGFGIKHKQVSQEHILTNYTFLQDFRILKTEPFLYIFIPEMYRIMSVRIVNTTILYLFKGWVSYTSRGEIKYT